MTFTMLLTVYDFLTDTGLYILIHVRIGETQQQTIRPFLIYKTNLSDNGLVMVRIVEALYAHLLIPVNSAGFEIFYRCLYMIVVIRIILESIDFISKTILEGLSEVDV